jgi:hypothetical protein
VPRLSREAIQAILYRDCPGTVIANPEGFPTQAELDAAAAQADAPPPVSPSPGSLDPLACRCASCAWGGPCFFPSQTPTQPTMSTVLDSSRITVVADVLSDAARTPCWVATTPEFPGCYGAGATDEAARDQLRASVTSLRAVLARQGRSA